MCLSQVVTAYTNNKDQDNNRPQTPAPSKRLSLNRGLKVWGGRGMSAVKAELSQIHYKNVLKPPNPKTLTFGQKRRALESYVFLEEKRDLKIKGRMVGGGNKQRSYASKQEASSPTSYIESVFLHFCN